MDHAVKEEIEDAAPPVVLNDDAVPPGIPPVPAHAGQSSAAAKDRGARPARPVCQCRIREVSKAPEAAPVASPVKIRTERKPGEPREGVGRRPVVGYVYDKSFVTRFGRVVKEDPLRCFKLPISFERCMGDEIPSSVFLRGDGNRRFIVQLTRYDGRWYINDGWRQFAERYSVDWGDMVNVTCTCDIAWDVEIIGVDGMPKGPVL